LQQDHLLEKTSLGFVTGLLSGTDIILNAVFSLVGIPFPDGLWWLFRDFWFGTCSKLVNCDLP
jgi:hypothetical protein